MKRKKIISTISLALSAILLASCGGSTTGESGESGDSAQSGEKVKITVMDSYAPEDPHGQYVYEYADAFMAENPDIEVEIQSIASNDIYTKVAAMSTNPEELPTIFWTSADHIPTLVDLGIPEDLNNMLDETELSKFAPGVVESATIDGMLTYYPVAVQPQAVIYRKDRFEENNLEIPTTWDEFVEVAKVLSKDTDGNGENDQWGFSMVGSNNSSGQSRFMSYLWSNGYDLVKKEGDKWVTDISTDQAFVDVFTNWTDMYTVDKVVPIGITEVDYPSAAGYFSSEYTSMFLTGPNALGITYSNNPELEGKLGSFMIPGDYPGTTLSAEGYAISSYASDAEKEAALKYLQFFAEHDAEQKFWKASGKIPATVEGQKVDFITGDDYAGYLAQIDEGCRETLSFPGMNGLKSALGNAYSAVFSGEKTNEQAVADLVTEVNTLLEDYN